MLKPIIWGIVLMFVAVLVTPDGPYEEINGAIVWIILMVIGYGIDRMIESENAEIEKRKSERERPKTQREQMIEQARKNLKPPHLS